jgi:hypothetical protein
MLSDISKNPLSLFEKTGNERFEYLLKCSSVNMADYTKLKLKRLILSQDRLEQKRFIESLKNSLGERPEECKKIDISLKSSYLLKAQEENSIIRKALEGLFSLGEELESLEASILAIKGNIKLVKDRITDGEKFVSEKMVIDTKPLTDEINNAYAINEKAVNYTNWTIKNEEYSIENTKWCNLDDDVIKIDSDIKGMINNIDFPLDGVTVEDEKILYNGINYDMLGTSEQILVSAALTAQQVVSQKNSIHAIRIDRGESMDEETQAKVMKVCNDIGVQVFISVVDRTSKDANFKVEIVEG